MRTQNFHWRARLLEDDPIKTLRYTYIWYDQADQPGAYITFTSLSEDQKRIMQVQELCYQSPDALRGVFAFIRRFSAQYDWVRMTLPQDEYLLGYFSQHNPISRSLKTKGQGRILDVAGVLERMRHPRVGGAYSLYVTDAFLPENTGLYHIRFENGDVHVQRLAGDESQADLCLSINALTVLAFGTINLRQALCRDDATLHQNMALLEQVFVQKPGLILDFF